MTPRPRRYLFLSLLGTCLFAVLAVLVATDSALVRLDTRLVTALHQFAVDHVAVHDFFVFVTNLGTDQPLWYVGAVAVLMLVLRRWWFPALVWTGGLLVSSYVTGWLKPQFGRVRPPFANIEGFSFPSGHAFASAAVYGMLALAILRVFHRYRWRWALAGALWVWIGLVAVSRPLLGVHYPSDVLAGMCLGLAWGFYWAALADWWDLRRMRGNAERVEQTQDPA
ncbi:MAG TPA: phosphatase PAP2 family protein [Gemmataceae bacterium]|nr:phosphatase PAP2 family protein [Gemmataceae bacterium]